MHYYCLVIMPKGEMPDEGIVEQLMEPGNAELEVEEHDVECGNCSGRGTYKSADEIAMECEDCGGTGVIQSNSNPNAWWDWYVIGGRWDGVLTGKSGGRAHSASLEDNSCRVADIVLSPERYPHTIVTPDGEVWMSEDISGETKPGRIDEERAILWHYAEHYCVVVDCHM
jgi:hypothetical protein